MEWNKEKRKIYVTANQTPIEIALGIDENGMTTAKRLYEFLEMDVRNYSRWVRNNITENQFAEEDTDYWPLVLNDERNFNPNPSQDYKLTARFAKKLSMLQKNARGEQARDYFTRVEDGAKKMITQLQELSPELQAIFLHDKKIRQVDAKVKAVNDDLQEFKRNLPLLPAEAELITHEINKRVVSELGGKESPAYKDSSLRGRVYCDIHRELKRQFGVTKYKYIKSCLCDRAISVVQSYQLPLILMEEIMDCNSQMNMEVA